jgi:predicted MFS family arabinose efflux permease
MCAAYRQLFVDLPRMRAMVGFSMLARLSTGAYPVPLVLLIQGTTHSYALAGAAEAGNLFAAAVTGPARGRAVDRLGSRIVIPRVALARTVALGVMWPVAHTRSAPAILGLAIVAGFAAPALPTAMRRQWQQLLGREDPRLEWAYAFEVNAQVMVFVIGPLLAAAGIATIGAGATLAGTGALLMVGAVAFAALAVSDQQDQSARAAGTSHLLRERGVAALVLVTVVADVSLGVVDIAVTAFAKGRDDPSAAGLLLGVAATSALITGTVFGARSWSTPPASQLRWLLGTSALLTVPLALAGSIPAMAGLLILASAPLAIQPIIVYRLLDGLAPRERAGESLAWISTANSAGVGIGYLAAGTVIQASGTTAAFLTGAALLAAAATVAFTQRHALTPNPSG